MKVRSINEVSAPATLPAPKRVKRTAQANAMLRAPGVVNGMPTLYKTAYGPRTVQRLTGRAIKPAETKYPDGVVSEDETPEFRLAYVTEAGDYISIPCTFALWKKIQGYKTATASAPATKGLNRAKRDHQFTFCVRPNPSGAAKCKKTNQHLYAVKMDVVPANHWMHGQSPTQLADVKTIKIDIDAHDGSMEVVQYPVHINYKAIQTLLKHIDEQESLTLNQELSGGYTVSSILGNTVELTPAV